MTDTLTNLSEYQRRVHAWMLECFGAEIAADRTERNHRFLEQALEFVQLLGCSASEAHQLVRYVFGRDVGEPFQEAGGVLVTLSAACRAARIDMAAAGDAELERVYTKIPQIRAKHAAKPKHSPLPACTGEPSATGAPAPERIWLEPAPGTDNPEYGQMWCQDNVWGDGATEYVRADLVSALSVASPATEAMVEAEARRLCTLAGLNPDDPNIAGQPGPRWFYFEPKARAGLGSALQQCALVLVVDGGSMQNGIFSTYERANAWADQQTVPCVVVYPMVIDHPEFGNVPQEQMS